MRASSKALVLFPLLATACGTGASSDYSPSYATLHGSIASSSVTTTADVRVALVWEVVNPRPGAAALKSTQELGLRAQFPSNFQMDINSLPPSEALSKNLAAGTLVVYEDTNRNGKLDLLAVDARSATDRVLGVPRGLTVVYVEGTPPAKAASGYFANVALQRGFNLLQESGWGAAAPVANTPWTMLPLSTEIPIDLTDAPQLSQYVCQQEPGLISACASAPSAAVNCEPPAPSTPPPAAPTPGDKPVPPGNGGNGSNGSNGTNGAGSCEAAATSPCGQARCNVNGAGASTVGPSNGPPPSNGGSSPPPSPSGTGDGPPCCKN